MVQNNCDDYNGEWDGVDLLWDKCQTTPSTKEPLDIVSNSKTDSFSKIELHIEELTNKVEELTSKVQDLSGQMSQPRPDPDVTLVWNNGRLERPNKTQNPYAWYLDQRAVGRRRELPPRNEFYKKHRERVERHQIKYPNAPQNRHAL